MKTKEMRRKMMSINDVAKKQLPWPPTLYFPMPLTTYLDSLPSDSSLFFVPGLLGSLLITHASIVPLFMRVLNLIFPLSVTYWTFPLKCPQICQVSSNNLFSPESTLQPCSLPWPQTVVSGSRTCLSSLL